MGDGPGELKIFKVRKVSEHDEAGQISSDSIGTHQRVLIHYKGSFTQNLFDSHGSLTTVD